MSLENQTKLKETQKKNQGNIKKEKNYRISNQFGGIQRNLKKNQKAKNIMKIKNKKKDHYFTKFKAI